MSAEHRNQASPAWCTHPLPLCPFLFQNKVVTVDGVRVKLQVRKEARGWGWGEGRSLPLLLTPTAGGLWPCHQPGVISCGARKTGNGFCLFDVCRKQFPGTLCYQRQLKVPSNKLRLTPPPPQFPGPHLF